MKVSDHVGSLVLYREEVWYAKCSCGWITPGNRVYYDRSVAANELNDHLHKVAKKHEGR